MTQLLRVYAHVRAWMYGRHTRAEHYGVIAIKTHASLMSGPQLSRLWSEHGSLTL